jgi:polyprenyl P-hydroxybenzoate/phenylacrylic acid decarboxylase-like protein
MTPSDERRAPIVVAITGATGVVYGIRTLEMLRELGIPTHLVLTDWGARTILAETDRKPQEVLELADEVSDVTDLGAPIGSGSFPTAGMVVAPCSMKSLAAIAHGLGQNLVHRAAETTMKERRRLVLLVRESPLSVIHLENLLAVARAGAIVAPPVPSFYARPTSVQDVVDQTVGRMLDHFSVHHPRTVRWGERRRPRRQGRPGQDAG